MSRDKNIQYWKGSNHDAMMQWRSTIPGSQYMKHKCDICGGDWDDSPACIVFDGDKAVIIWFCCKCEYGLRHMLDQLGIKYTIMREG